MQDLADDIARIGLLNAITVRRIGDTWHLVAGNRRLNACRKLGWSHIPCVQVDCTDKTAAIIRLHENTKRAQLSPVEEACQIQDFKDTFDANTTQLLEAFACSESWLEGRLEILSFTPDLQNYLHTKRITLGAARLLMRLPDPQQRDMYIRCAADHGCSIATARLWLTESLNAARPESTDTFSAVGQMPESPISTTTVQCFACQRQIELQHAIRTSICVNCSSNIAEAMQTQQQPETQPAYQPTNPTGKSLT